MLSSNASRRTSSTETRHSRPEKRIQMSGAVSRDRSIKPATGMYRSGFAAGVVQMRGEGANGIVDLVFDDI